MSYAYEQKQRNPPARSSTPAAHTHQNAVPNSAYAETGIVPGDAPMSAVRDHIESLRRGESAPSAADKGHRIDLPEAMRAKMESSFGMDLSAVKLYESQMAAEAGTNAVAQGNEIMFAPGKADFVSQSGQELLGHELSHIASQARGEVRGGGFLMDHGLEARADREGAMAARGETVYSGPVTGTLSNATPSAAVAGPMQADKDETKEEKDDKGNVDQDTQCKEPVIRIEPVAGTEHRKEPPPESFTRIGISRKAHDNGREGHNG